MPMPRSTASGKVNFFETQVSGIGRVQGHQDAVEFIVALQHVQVNVWVVVTLKPTKRHLPAFFATLQGFNSAPGAKISAPLPSRSPGATAKGQRSRFSCA